MPETTTYRPFIDHLAAGRDLPADCDRWAFKPVRGDLTTFTSARSGQAFQWPFPSDSVFSAANTLPGVRQFKLSLTARHASQYTYNTVWLLLAYNSNDVTSLSNTELGAVNVTRVKVVAVLDAAKALKGANGVDLSGGNFAGLNLTQAGLGGANLAGADLQRSRLKLAELSNANLSGAKLRRANLTEAGLSGADLRNAEASRASFKDADLRNANLAGANLQHSFLGGAEFDRTNLQGTSLSYADLKSASGRPVNFASARSDTALNVPDQFTRVLQVPANLPDVIRALRDANVEFETVPADGGPF